MCRATNAGTLIPTCEACVAQFPITDNDDNDRRDRDDDRDDVNGSSGFRLSTTLSCVYLTKLCRCLRAPHPLQLLDYNVQSVIFHFSGYGASDEAWRGSGRSGRCVCDADWQWAAENGCAEWRAGWTREWRSGWRPERRSG
jgi:hypothetical protein